MRDVYSGSNDISRVVNLIDKVAAKLEPQNISHEARRIFLAEARPVASLLSGSADPARQKLYQSLNSLFAIIEGGGIDHIARPSVVDAKSRRSAATALRNLRRALLAIAMGMAASMTQVAAAIPDVGDPISHPTSGESLRVVDQSEDGLGVVAEDSAGNEYFIFYLPPIGTTIINPESGEGEVHLLGYRAAGSDTLITDVKYVDGRLYSDDDELIAQFVYGTPADGETEAVVLGSAGMVSEVEDPGTDDSSASVPGDGIGQFSHVRRASNGKNGRAGALFVPAASGKSGSTGDTITGTFSVPSVSASAGPGVIIASIGGNGGKGGNGYLGATGKAGGTAGAGGTVNVTVKGNSAGDKVVTTGNDGHGVIVQSRAGVGGKGGTGYASHSGGSGGDPSRGGSVILNNQIDVETSGLSAHGVVAQSLGGGGGDGGSSYGLFGQGAAGSNGGDGGSVELKNSGDITTNGDGSFGIFAQSIGGVGGDSGSAGGIVALTSSSGGGGNGGDVTIIAEAGRVVTNGEAAHGIFAQSIGGGGGNAGRTSGVVAVGRTGGVGGIGGNVTVETTERSAVTTNNIDAHAIFVQSIGGGGGNSGKSSGLVSIGGNGGSGGVAGDVRVDNSGGAFTKGDGSNGIFAQSIGGGGGTGSASSGLVAIGGKGGTGGFAGDAIIHNNGWVKTEGNASRGIYVQSIGGGGGDGGSTLGLVAIGGSGGGGGAAGTVSITNKAHGLIQTSGDGSDAILAQSIGGGGGSGGAGRGFLGVGGSGASGGDGREVDVTNEGDISTEGDMARGILAQSIGGGGGVGGAGGGIFSTGGDGGSGGRSGQDANSYIGGNFDSSSSTETRRGSTVVVNNSGTISTKGNYSSAIQAQSIGGGGGDGGNSGGVFLGIGGRGAMGGDAADVTIGHSGWIETAGADSNGIFAQSIGGGGGSGGDTFTLGLFASVAIGGAGGDGGKAGTVTLNLADRAGEDGPLLPVIQTEGDRSRGVILQAIGGGGGNGGSASSIAIGAGFSASIAIGGSGGSGGDGGAVIVNDKIAVETQGDFAEAMLLQSIGGGGGNGGYSTSVSAAAGVGAASFSVSIGGAGEAGGAGGAVTANTGGVLKTSGDQSIGLIAQSIGGGGGNGGFAVSAAGSAGLGAVSAAVGVGGRGEKGGRGGKVDVSFDGDIFTEGDMSGGALIQSVGGGGGNGGFSLAISAALGAVGSGSVATSLGGTGGSGGVGGAVDGHITGRVETVGSQSNGLVAQSIGGGGGNGGFSIAGSLNIAGGGSAGAAVGIGGAGGIGNTGGTVNASIGGGVLTEGDQSIGLIAQSIGGGGGSGGFAVSAGISMAGIGSGTAVLGIGGAGGGGGDGGSATGRLDGGFETHGNQSGAMLVQSVGGGGGAGGFTVAGGIAAGGVGSGAAVLGMGGAGGLAGHGGAATGVSTGDGVTRGDQSTAITVQSIGGGGGAGGFNVSGAVAFGGIGAGAVGVGLGGNGAAGGNASTATGDIEGDLATWGDQSDGVLVQSIGGGGGSAGFNITGSFSASGVGSGAVAVGLGASGGAGGAAQKAELTRVGNSYTDGDQSNALVVQSIGGGGGSGGFNVTGAFSASGTGSGAVAVGLGGSGGSAGNAGVAKLDVKGITQTAGDNSTAITAQSIGGGGGAGGFNVTGTISAAGTGSGAVAVGLGGSGGSGSDADVVDLKIAGGFDENGSQIAALTAGAGSGAILAQSIGGGGGSGGFNATLGLSAAGAGSGSVAVGLGGEGGTGGSAGNVKVDIAGMTITNGANSNAITAQSIGGGGGAGGFNVTGAISAAGTGSGAVAVGLGGSGGSGGTASQVDLDIMGGLSKEGLRIAAATYGDGSRGILAQSIGGGGGSGGFNATLGLSAAGAGAGTVAVGLGGDGGEGGASGKVLVDIAGVTITDGNDATAITAQSIGGGGGSGGFNVAGGLSAAGTGAGTIAVGLGGSGGSGNISDDVMLGIIGGTDENDVQLAALTSGDGSGAILAQSIGGGGGSGGFNISGGLTAAGTGGGSVGVGLGGNGGMGANAARVQADVAGLVRTEGADAHGIVAQSIGGGGGSGGFNISGALAAAGTGAGSVSVGLGGFGAGGGNAGDVAGVLRSDVITLGDRSDAILYQSIGGGGGNGGMNISGALSAAGTGAGAVSVGLGGFGGSGGHAGHVSVDSQGNIFTAGDQARALVAQSIGGGGGNGGFNVSGGLAASGTGAGAVSVGIGGMGGDGGNAGVVRVDHLGLIATQGDGSDGLVALSLGGGGGTGGMNITGVLTAASKGAGSVGVGVGGFGGEGGEADDVYVDLIGVEAGEENRIIAAVTEGDGASAVIAQSIGGGGGTGGFNVTGAISASAEGAGSLAVGVGGMGGGGGDGKLVVADITGDVITYGDESQGILAQSLGGGGGSGGFNVSGTLTAVRGSAGSLAVGLGGFGGSGGDGGDVRGAISGNVSTWGDGSGAVTYQSVGGGGGSGGFNVSAGISISVAASGGDGGSSGFGASVGVGIGGFGGDGGNAGQVSTRMEGDIFTSGAGSYGALFQSAGGGGGNGGMNVTGNIAIGNTTSASVGFGLGGFGGKGGYASRVSADLAGNVVTLGDDAFGALLQSVGGGGGNGGLNVSGALAITGGESNAVAASVGIGGFGGGGGNAGEVRGRIIGDYFTEGENADAIIAQSLGGGGGNGGMNIAGSITVGRGTSTSVSLGLGGFGGDGGEASDVRLIRAGNTFTTGANSDGITLQSIAGGGGNGGMNIAGSVAVTLGEDKDANSVALGVGGFGGGGGNAGDVRGRINGHVIATGVDPAEIIEGEDGEADRRIMANGSNAILAQSIGGGGGNGGLNISGALAIDRPASSSDDEQQEGEDQGSGGNGGDDSSGKSRAISIGVGGFGGSGGDAGLVDLHIASADEDMLEIQAVGDDRGAIVAQSIGGGGGMGGINIAGGLSLDQALQIGIGGFGSDGGTADKVSVVAEAHISAIGTGSRGIMAQSIGGGGGAGGINISGTIVPSTAKDQVSLTFGLGGFGGAGNISDAVLVDHYGSIMVDGVDSIGLLAQSIAGGGGSGGLNIAGAVNRGTDAYVIAAGVGGFGGDGADAGTVDVISNGIILVNNVIEDEGGAPILKATEYTGGAKGILAQSIGGGGGTAGINLAGVYAPKGNPITLGLGGSGGSGGDAAAVSVVRGYRMVDGEEVQYATLLATSGDHSDGLVAQSIGGGGGNGNYNVSVAATSDNEEKEQDAGEGGSGAGSGDAGKDDQGETKDRPAINLQVGGSGAGAGSGDDVTVRHAGMILTDGLFSDGIVAQSIGGGGGDAGANVHLAKLSKLETFSVSLSLGGGTGAGGTGGNVLVDHDGIIGTNGDYSIGVKAQSIGGGGGSAASDISKGADGSATNINISIGRSGGTGGAAGNVDLLLGGVIQTRGVGSSAVLAQSIGGGGGDSTAISISADRSSGGNSSGETGTGDGKSDKAKETPTKNSIQVSIGLDGGEGATGGHVSVATKADMEIDTVGDDARGIHAQSIGGGGGAGGGAANSITNSALALSIAVGGQGGIGATAGRVDVANLADIATRGDGADAIFAQSIGGGGGVGGSAESQISYEVPKSAKDDKAKPDPKAKDQEKTADAKVAETGMGLSLALGGSGGSGAASDGVSVSNAGIISTRGDKSFGIRAQSIGGGGGVAGATSATLTQGERSSNTLQLAIGGSGGEGAAAGAVTVENTGAIVTGGDFASAISAQSIGGGGGDAAAVTIEESGAEGDDGPSTPGDGGDAPANGAKDAVITTRSINLAVGGSGGEGGVGGDIIVRNMQVDGVQSSGILLTEGMESHGILAQSIGGGGGNSSIVQISHDLEASDTSFALNLALGGSGGSGNRAGNILIENDGLIQTNGDGAHGIFAQSIGGGGGNASVAMAVNAALGSGESSSSGSPYFLAVGGSGGTGGDGGSVTVNNSGSIGTMGRDAHGIFAQSIGGGGGNADLAMTVTDNAANLLLANALSAVLGGTGGAGGMAGPVVVNHTGDIYVAGEGSRAIKAESINGGGGSIRIDLDQLLGVALDLAKDKIEGAEAGEKILGYVNKGLDYLDGGDDGFAANSVPENRALVSARAGAIGAENNSAGNVTVNSTGRIFVLGDHSIGSSVQAIGGGGGNIALHASVGTAALEGSEAGRFAAAFAANEDDLDSGEIPSLSSVDNLGGVAPLSFLLELGGIDGVGNHGGDISNSHDDDMVVQGNHSLGILDQSIGGGGGTTAGRIAIPEGALVDRVDLIIGAVNSENESGGAVERTQNGAVQTEGAFSHGVLLQSIGGGGGFGTISLSGEDAQLHDTYVQMGLQGGTGAHAGVVTGVFNGLIATSGDYSTALIAQSIGGGGGAANISGSGAIDVSLGATGGASGNASTVNISIDGLVFTDGAASHGIFLQSIGGGGGLINSDSDQMLLDLSADNEGDGGDISLTHKGIVNVVGDRSFGVVAQSLGGGGGWVDGKFAGSAGGQGMGGAIELNLENQILATGEDATAIFAQSEGGTGADDIIINLAELVRGGSGNGAGVWIEGGKDNLVTNHQSLSAVSGLAALGGDGNDHISNEGFIIGNIQLGGGDNRLMNNRGATMIAFQTIDLGGTGGGLDGGNANSLVNDGQFLMGLDAPAWPLDLHNGETFGNLDLEGDPRANLLFGARVINHVELNGNFIQTSNGHMAFDVAFGAQPSDHVHVTGDAWVDGTAKVTLTALADAKPITLFATDGIGRDSGLEVEDTLALDYSILADQAGIHLTYESDFGQHFLRPNQRAVGKHMDSALDVGDSEGIGRLMAALGNLMSDQQDVYQSIFDELNPEGLVAPLHAQFMNASSFGDNIFGCEERGDEGCVFVGGRIVDYRRTGDRDYLRVTSSGFSTHIGMERALSEDWSLSGAFGYDKIEDLKVDYSRVQTSGEGVNFGFGARGEVGKLDLALNISGGWSWYSSKRTTSVFDETEALSNPKTGYLRSSLEVAHSAKVGGWRFKPALKLSATKLNFAGMMEYGAGDIGYVARKHGQSFVSFQPNITVAYEEKGSGLGFRTNVGAVVHSKSQLTLPVRFIGSNGSSDAAMLATPLDKHSLTTSNFLYYKAGGLSFGLDYEAEIGAHSRIQRYGARINWSF